LHPELKMHLIKKLVNICTLALDKLLPDVEPCFPQGKMVKDIFIGLDNVFRVEAFCGRFDDRPCQKINKLKDRNFQHYLNAMRKILIYLSENDRYYRMWLGLAMILAKQEYHKTLETLSREEFVRLHALQWELSLSCISESHFQLHKSEFLDMMLAAHLPNLTRKRALNRGSS
jgi:hypothetical protein